MNIDTKTIATIEKGNLDFSRAVQAADKDGIAIITENGKPKYAVIRFDEYCKMRSAADSRQIMIDSAVEELISENLEALKELAK